MKSESNFIIEVWESVKEHIPAAQRGDVAFSILKAAEEYGFDSADLHDILDEDKNLTQAFRDVFGDGEEEEDYED